MDDNWTIPMSMMPYKADLKSGKVPSSQLPSYVDSVVEAYVVGSTPYAADWLSASDGGSPLTPAAATIYYVVSSGDYQYLSYRWGGTKYVYVGNGYLDPTLSTTGASADAKAVGDALKQVWNLNSAYATRLQPAASGDEDYNDDKFKAAGTWRVTSNNEAKRITNCPVDVAHRLFVIVTTTPGRVIQIVLANSSTVEFWLRFYNGSTWLSWRRVAYFDEVDGAVCTSQAQLTTLTTSITTDYNTLTDVGNYVVSSAVAPNMANCPYNGHHRLYVTKLYNNSTSVFQIVISSDQKMTFYTRRQAGGTWTSWAKYEGITDDTKHFPVYNQSNSTFPLNVSRVMRGGVTVGSTMPRMPQTGEDPGVTVYYDKDTEIPGVVYSSVWRDGLDVYRNLTLETYYSALANPASVLYTKDYTDVGIDNAHAWYGGVCSTYVSAVMGFRCLLPTEYITDYIEPKPMESAYDIEAGDMLLTSGHIAMISNLLVDEYGSLNGVVTAQETGSVFRTNIRKIADLPAYLEKMEYTVMKPKTPIQDYPVLGKPEFNAELIYERGNNTYVTDADLTADGGAWFYIPNATIIDVIKDGVAVDSATVSELPTKTVNSTTVYDLSAFFESDGVAVVGEYELWPAVMVTPSGGGSEVKQRLGTKPCKIKVIDTGSATLENNVLTLSNWNGCVPYAYYIVLEIEGTGTNTAMQPSAGYHCSYRGKCAPITVEEGATSIAIEVPSAFLTNVSRYKCWIEYDTGCGMKQVFTDPIDI